MCFIPTFINGIITVTIFVINIILNICLWLHSFCYYCDCCGNLDVIFLKIYFYKIILFFNDKIFMTKIGATNIVDGKIILFGMCINLMILNVNVNVLLAQITFRSVDVTRVPIHQIVPLCHPQSKNSLSVCWVSTPLLI